MEKIRNWLKNQETIKIAITLILLIALTRGVIYATVFPLWQAPDEPVQFQYIDFYARKHLPFEKKTEYKKNDDLIIEKVDKEILDSMYDLKTWKYIGWEKTSNWLKSGHRLKKNLAEPGHGVIYKNPPGYPILSLTLYAPLFFTDVRVRAYAMRMLSVFLGVLVVYLGYRTAKELFPDDIFIVLGAPLFIAFVPMFTHISSAINPDNLVNFSAALFIFYSVKILKKFSWVSLVGILLSVFISIYTKKTAFFTLIMLFFLPAFSLVLSKSSKLKSPYKRYGLISIYFTTVLLAGLNYIPIILTKIEFFTFDLEPIIFIKELVINYFKTKTFGDFIYTIKLFSENFWASFGWGLRIKESSYLVLHSMSLIPLFGLLSIPAKRLFNKRNLLSRYQYSSLAFLGVLLFISFTIVVVKQVLIAGQNIPARYIFPAIIPIAVFTTLGFSQCLKNKKTLLLSLFTLMFLFDASVLINNIIPYFYKTPQAYSLHFIPFLANLFDKPFLLNSIFFYILIFSIYLFLIACLAYYLFQLKRVQEV